MNDDIIAALDELKGEAFVSRWVFTSAALDGRRMHNNVGTRFAAIVKKAKLLDANGEPRFSLHDLRRSFVTRLLNAGVNPKVVRKLAGHAKLETTMKYYAGVQNDTEVEAVQRIALASNSQSCDHSATKAG